MAEEQDDRFKKVVKQVAIALFALCIVMPWLPLPEIDPNQAEEMPPRFAKLLLEKPVPPPPPPVVPTAGLEPTPTAVVTAQPTPDSSLLRLPIIVNAWVLP